MMIPQKVVRLSTTLQSAIDDFERDAGDLDDAVMVMDFLQDIISWRFRGGNADERPMLSDFMRGPRSDQSKLDRPLGGTT